MDDYKNHIPIKSDEKSKAASKKALAQASTLQDIINDHLVSLPIVPSQIRLIFETLRTEIATWHPEIEFALLKRIWFESVLCELIESPTHYGITSSETKAAHTEPLRHVQTLLMQVQNNDQLANDGHFIDVVRSNQQDLKLFFDLTLICFFSNMSQLVLAHS